jgi:outer membrane protein TolC
MNRRPAIRRPGLLFALLAISTGCAPIEIVSRDRLPTLRIVAASPVTTPSRSDAGLVAVDETNGESLLSTSGSLNLTIEGAIAAALARNRALRVNRINPAIQKTFEADQRAAFDPVVTGDLRYARTRTDIERATGMEPAGPSVSIGGQTNAGIGLFQFLPTGTDVSLTLDTDHAAINTGRLDPSDTARAALSISQQLLRGRGVAVNLVGLRQARLSALASDYELRGFVESLIAQVEFAYWDYVLAERQVAIVEESLQVAQKQLDETLERIRVGKLAEIERFSGQAEVALRREALINGRSQVEFARLGLLRLLSPAGDSLAPRPIRLLSDPVLTRPPEDSPEEHLAVALRLRPELNQARLAYQNDELELVRTANGVLPDLELFVNLGKTGYANSFAGNVSDVNDSRSTDFAAGLAFSYTLGNRAARARHRRARLARDQQLEAIANLRELIEQDVRGALIEINRVREQASATAVTRRLQQETLRAEQEKLAVGRSTLLLVSQTERDLLSAQINEVQASIAYLKAIVDLYRLDGSLLERRGIVCPGDGPVELTDER